MRRDADWRALLTPLEGDGTYEERLDALLEQVVALTGLEAAYLYVIDETGERFHLERARAAAGTASPGAAEGGAEAIETSPPLHLPATAADGEARVVGTPVGPLWSVPLGRIGLVQAGPISGSKPPRRVRAALGDAAFPLAIVVRQAREEASLRARLAALSARVEAGQRLAGSALDLGRYVELLLELALRSTRTESGFVAIVGPAGLEIRAESGLPAGFADGIDLDPESGVFDWSPAAEGGALIVRSLDSAAAAGIRSILAVPLIEGDEPLGVFALINFGDGGTFDEGSLELLATFADQIRQMLHNDRLFRDFASRYLQTVEGLAASLDVRRPHTHGHHERVAANAAALAAELGHDDAEVEAVRIAGLIHDAGMAGGSDYQADVDHPSVGAALVEQLPLHPWVAAGVSAHHEWWDGWGFPLGLAGEAVPRAGRILAAAEFLDEMSSGDPVREPWGADRLVAELEVRGRTQLEPEVAAAAIRLVRQDALVLGGGDSGHA